MAQNTYSLATRIKMVNGLSMPQIHLGLYMTSPRETTQIVQWAIEAGYRGFDSAQMYGNERETGQGIETFLSSKMNTKGLQRKDIHYTTKLVSNSTFDAARKSITQSVQKSGLGYVDLFLLHSPYGGKQARLESWRAVEQAIEDGEVKIGGVSNFGVRHIQEMIDSKPKVMPAVNQIEVHPFNTRAEIRSICDKNNIMVEAYAPLARALRMSHPTITTLATKYACTPGQLMVRWSCQHGMVPLPKSSKKARIIENSQVEHFAISSEDIRKMDELDEYLVTDWDPVDCP
ncbi:MAG: hypothetical protein M1828_004229 [Chrysothrix sp. TS-e1954]|nr:MAG: hypothetical protein M1828_004229 [Chrysothrix sp. TS-e1954]